MPKNTKLIENIKKDIEKSGYPLEIEIYKLLRKYNWTITPQYYYKDRITSTERSIDYVCGKTTEGSDEPYKKVVIRLAIECKNLDDKYWILFSMDETEVESMDFPITYLQFFMPEEKDATFSEKKIKQFIEFKNCSHYNADNVPRAFNHYVPFGKKDSFHDAMQQSIGALNYSFEENKKAVKIISSDIFRNLYVFYPIIVCNKNLFEFKTDSDDINEIDHIMYVTRGIGESYSAIAIDVVTTSGFERLLERIDHELTQLSNKNNE